MEVTKIYIENIIAIEKKLPEIAKQAVLDNSEDIINIVKFAQLGEGKNSFGLPLAWSDGDGTYANSTQDIADHDPNYSREEPKTEGQSYNFNWSGETFDFMGLKAKKTDEYEIFTKAGKQSLLEGIYGEIFKLTKENNDWVNRNIIEPAIYRYIIENMFKV